MAVVQFAACSPTEKRSPEAAVLAFARPVARPAGFSVRDRIELARWSRLASASGISRVRMEVPEPADPPHIGGFMLIYAHGADWAGWGVAPRDDGLIELWLMPDNRTLGCFGSLAEALAVVRPV